MRTKLSVLAAGLVLSLAAPALAHHPFAAEFDWKKPTTLNGTITKIDWANPHTRMYLDARDQNGSQNNWTVELGGPGALRRYGWNQKLVKVGDQVTVDGWLARDGSRLVSAKSVTINGKEMFAGSSFFDEPQRVRPVATTGGVKKSTGTSTPSTGSSKY